MNEERCGNWSQIWFGNASTSFFLLLSPSSPYTKSFNVWTPITSAPSRLFIGNEGRRLNSSSPRRAVASTWSNLACPGELVTSPISLMVAQASQRLAWASQGSEKAPKWLPFFSFWVFFAFFTEMLRNLWIVQQLVSSSLIWPTRTKTLANDHPRRN